MAVIVQLQMAFENAIEIQMASHLPPHRQGRWISSSGRLGGQLVQLWDHLTRSTLQ